MQISHNEIRHPDVTGVLLAGGESTRMGRDKALIEVSGQTMFSRPLALLRQFFFQVIIAGNRPDLALPGIPAVPDLYPGSALGGLHTGLAEARTDWIFVIACDMPYPDSRLLEMLLDMKDGFAAVVPETPRGYEPLFALYHKSCLPVFEDALKQASPSIHRLYPRLNVGWLNWREMPPDSEISLLNLNTPDDFDAIPEDAR